MGQQPTLQEPARKIDISSEGRAPHLRSVKNSQKTLTYPKFDGPRVHSLAAATDWTQDVGDEILEGMLFHDHSTGICGLGDRFDSADHACLPSGFGAEFHVRVCIEENFIDCDKELD